MNFNLRVLCGVAVIAGQVVAIEKAEKVSPDAPLTGEDKIEDFVHDLADAGEAFDVEMKKEAVADDADEVETQVPEDDIVEMDSTGEDDIVEMDDAEKEDDIVEMDDEKEDDGVEKEDEEVAQQGEDEDMSQDYMSVEEPEQEEDPDQEIVDEEAPEEETHAGIDFAEKQEEEYESAESETSFYDLIGQVIKIDHLTKKGKKYNQILAKVTAYDEKIGKYDVQFTWEGKAKTIKIPVDNMEAPTQKEFKGWSEPPQKGKKNAAPAAKEESSSGPGLMDMMSILSDPDVRSLMTDPKKAAKITDIMKKVQENPMSAMGYMADPDIAPVISKVMAKCGGMSGLMKMLGGAASMMGGNKNGGGGGLGGIANMVGALAGGGNKNGGGNALGNIASMIGNMAGGGDNNGGGNALGNLANLAGMFAQ